MDGMLSIVLQKGNGVEVSETKNIRALDILLTQVTEQVDNSMFRKT